MAAFRSRLYNLRLALRLTAAIFVLSCFAHGQLLYQDQEVRVHGLPSMMAVSNDPQQILLTSMHTILHDNAICCGKDSALEDSVRAADPTSLKDVASKVEGRHLLSDGRPINVKAEYLAAKETSGGHLIEMLRQGHASLMLWNSHLYVLHGAVYFWQPGDDGGPYAVLHKLLLWDTRYSDSLRQVTFIMENDDTSKIEGFLFVEAKLQ